jgi:hypothetical protein
MVGASGSPALAPPRGPAVDDFHVDGGRSRIFVSTSQGARRQRFLALMVVLLDFQLRHLPRGLLSTFLSVDGGCSRITSSGTSHGSRR